MEKLHLISSCLVPMSTNEISISRMVLTPWDLRLLLYDPIQKGLLFNKPVSKEVQITIIDHLKNALSRTLDFFPPLAGRLCTVNDGDNRTCYFVDCNNKGAEFTHAVVADVSVSDILEANYIPEIISDLFPLNGVPNFEGVSKPLLGVQITELVDGLFIGCAANHAVVDGTSFWHFVNSWSEISRGFGKISKSPVFQRNNYNYSIPIRAFEKTIAPDNIALPPLLERVFHFSKESVAKLKAKANSEADSYKISSLQAVSAHLWRSVIRCRRKLQNMHVEVPCNISVAIGGRTRIPLPDGYFGNAVYFARTKTSETELLMPNGLGHAGLKINELVARQTNEAVIKVAEDWMNETPVAPRIVVNNTFAITSSPRHNVYGNDFGWGKPIAVRSGKGQKFDGKITPFPAALEHGGMDVEVSLATEILQALEDDDEFMEAFNI